MRKIILALALAGIFAGCADKDINKEDKPSSANEQNIP